ncbi:MAG: sulfatase-like hydrolase/transferase [Clostridia bacterium]|nr:sulfatase-like hydrolase/transferase [Clostridia bacterium]
MKNAKILQTRSLHLVKRWTVLISCLSIAACSGDKAEEPVVQSAEQEAHLSEGEAEAASGAASNMQSPNIILIVADDLGVNDLSISGNILSRTPFIDSLGTEGVNYANAYVTSPVCATSRAGLLTGRYQQRFGMEHNPIVPSFAQAVVSGRFGGTRAGRYVDVPEAEATPRDWQGMPTEEITLAEILKDAGYVTSAVGKWHLGAAHGQSPNDQGFDDFYGFYGGGSLFAEKGDETVVDAYLEWSGIDNFVWRFLEYTLFRNGEPVEERDYMTYVFANEASSFIEKNRNNPFFLYLAFNAPHNPLQAPRDWYDAFDHIEDHHTRVYYAMIAAMDEAVGGILETLEAEGLAENTIVIFTSDNGGADYTRIAESNAPYRGWKASFWEGGIKVPLLLRWPAAIPTPQVEDQPVTMLDLVPTIANAAGADLPTDRAIDGRDLMSDHIRDEPRNLFWRNGHYRSVRSGDLKLIVSDLPERIWLYDLASDPTEQTNIADRRQEDVKRLRQLLDRHDEILADKPLWPSYMFAPVYADYGVGLAPEDEEDFVDWPG